MDGEGIVEVGGALREQDLVPNVYLGRPNRISGQKALVIRFGPRPFDQDGSVNIVRVRRFDIQPVITFTRPRLIDVKGMDTRRVLHAVNLRDDVGLVSRHEAAHAFYLGNLIDLIIGEPER